MPGFLRLALSTLCALSLTQPALAQSFAAEQIDFDVSDDGTGSGPLLIAAYQPVSTALPQFAQRATGRDALVTRVGLPSPSIILGRIAPGQEETFGITTLLPDTVEQVGFAYDDLETRNRMRDEDPEMFRKLIEQGHIDPPEDILNAALQTELQRMNCYRSGIDGAWGPGSRRSVSAYFGKREDGQTWPDEEPSNDLFRTIILQPDVTCDTPRVTTRTTSTTTTTRRNTTRTTTAARPAAPAPKPAAPAAKPKIKSGGGIGVFR